ERSSCWPAPTSRNGMLAATVLALPLGGDEGVVVAQVIAVVIAARREHRAHGVGAERAERMPYERRHVDADAGAIETESRAHDAVVGHQRERTAQRDDELLLASMGMTRSADAGAHTVQIIEPLRRERQALAPVDHRQGTARIRERWYRDQARTGDDHGT